MVIYDRESILDVRLHEIRSKRHIFESIDFSAWLLTYLC